MKKILDLLGEKIIVAIETVVGPLGVAGGALCVVAGISLLTNWPLRRVTLAFPVSQPFNTMMGLVFTALGIGWVVLTVKMFWFDPYRSRHQPPTASPNEPPGENKPPECG